MRRRNLIPVSALPYRTHLGDSYDSGDFARILDRVLAASDWNGFDERKNKSKENGKLRGRGLSMYLEWTGALPTETVDIEVGGRRHRDGVLRNHGDGPGPGDELHAAHYGSAADNSRENSHRPGRHRPRQRRRQRRLALGVRRRLGRGGGGAHGDRARQGARGRGAGGGAAGHRVPQRPLRHRRHRPRRSSSPRSRSASRSGASASPRRRRPRRRPGPMARRPAKSRSIRTPA